MLFLSPGALNFEPMGIDTAEFIRWALESREALCASPEIHKMIKNRIDLLQQDLAHYEQVKRFILLPKPFTIATGELTNTLKVKRRVVYEKYAKEIEQIYIDAEKETKK